MKTYRVNRIHPDSMIEECLRLTVEAENAEEAKQVLQQIGYAASEIVVIDDEFELIKVRY